MGKGADRLGRKHEVQDGAVGSGDHHAREGRAGKGLHITIRRSTGVHAVASEPGCAERVGERDETMKYGNTDEIGPGHGKTDQLRA